LAQKKEIKRLEKVREREATEADQIAAKEDEEARQRAVEDFEKVQLGLEAKVGAGRSIVGRVNGKVVVEEDIHDSKRGEKRKFELDEDELLRIARDERNKMRREIDHEKASKTTLPSFWVPSVTPTSNSSNTLHTVTKKIKASPVCPSAPHDRPHYYSLHTLVTVNFTEEEADAGAEKRRICPACKKALSNSSKAMLTKPCGHVLCKRCVGEFMSDKHFDPHASPGKREKLLCYVCETNLRDPVRPDEKNGKISKEKIQPGLVEINAEGTGFAATGDNKVEKVGVAFQC
jgi:nitric oxide synthase-interacting protein